MWRATKWITGSIVGLLLIVFLTFVQFAGPKEARATAWDIATVLFETSTTTVKYETNTTGIFFKPDGSIMYLIGITSDKIHQFQLSTPWDISTAGWVKSISTLAQDSQMRDIFFKPDGSIMYTVGYVNDKIYQYNLSVSWDVSSALFEQSTTTAIQDTNPAGLFFTSDGLKMYSVGTLNKKVYRYDLSIPWDISTSGFIQSTSAVPVVETTPNSIFFDSAGIYMYTTGSLLDQIHQFQLSTPWDISTAGWVKTINSPLQPSGLFFKPDGLKMYISAADTIDIIYQFDLSSLSFPSPNNIDGWGAGVSAGGVLNW